MNPNKKPPSTRKLFSSGSKFEREYNYSRAVLVGKGGAQAETTSPRAVAARPSLAIRLRAAP